MDVASNAHILNKPGLPFDRFVWGAGIECSFIPHLGVDQFEWTQHNRYWREDFRRAREDLGITHLRYAFPWHVLEPRRGEFDWSYSDERMAEFARLGIEPLMDVMHFGTPLWLRQAVGDPEFPEALERFTSAIVDRYKTIVRVWCPFNEPLVSALFSGDFGFWPPHQRKWRGYMPVLSRIAQGVARGIRAVRQVMPEATVLLCDSAEAFRSRHKTLAAEVARRNLRRFLLLDLISGRVDLHHPLFEWVTSFGLSELDLNWFAGNRQAPDVIGLDYYAHTDWQLDLQPDGAVRQRRADNPTGLYSIGQAYWQRYGLPMMVTETSIEGPPISREVWLESNVDHIRRLREEGVPMLGLIWWPMIDHLDWDGALTHRVGKIHNVGMWNLVRQADGSFLRQPTPLIEQYREFVQSGDARVGPLDKISYPSPEADEEQLPPLGQWMQKVAAPIPGGQADPAPGLIAAPPNDDEAKEDLADAVTTQPSRYGIVVFSHLRWGFVWQRPQQFLSRFAKKHPILFIEEPFFDLASGAESRVDHHRVMPNVMVAAPHCPPEMRDDPHLPELLRRWTLEAMEDQNEQGMFERPLLWYYSPMDSAWSLGHIPHRGVVYDCMDELSQFTGAPRKLVEHEARLMRHADIVFTGGYNLGDKKRQQHPNVHTFGCGVEYSHFSKAQHPATTIPPDIDFVDRPIIGWFGVVDERVDYSLVGEIARLRPDWSFAMVGPVVKVDPSLLPHASNLYWLGGRDYQQLPNYCRAFDVNMMCFAINAATEFINPTKGLEYMATGKPIVGTPVRDVVKQWSEIVLIAKTAPEFVAAIQQALDRGPEVAARVQRGVELAKKCAWEGTVAAMQGLIDEAINRPQRQDEPTPEPLEEDGQAYAYAGTQGS